MILSLIKRHLKLLGKISQNYDFPINYNVLDKRDKRYNSKNYEQGKRIKNLGISLNIFIPLQNLKESLVNELVKDLIELY